MSLDFAALTAAVGVGLPEFRVCLLVSRDGLPLAAHPASEETRAMGVWNRLTGLGELERGFVEVGDEFWAFSRRGPYSAVAVTGAGARPGVVLDRLDQFLLATEEARVRKEAFRPPQARESQSGEQARGPRSILHREARQHAPADAPVVVSEQTVPAAIRMEPEQAPRPAAPAPPVAPAPPPGVPPGGPGPRRRGSPPSEWRAATGPAKGSCPSAPSGRLT